MTAQIITGLVCMPLGWLLGFALFVWPNREDRP